ncbi:MAG: glycosyltransferase family 9 protein [Anaerolineae bacterium]|nr:glycosyltransferase family 9 protein [Anaerolineae bacterium]
MPDPRTMPGGASLSPRHRLRRRLLQTAGVALTATQPAPAPPAVSPTGAGRRVLLIRPDHLGDVLLATPAFEALRAAWPDAHVTALVGPWAETVARRNPYLDAVLSLPFPGFTRAAPASALAPYRLARREAERLRAYRFDTAVVLRFDHWWGALLAALARIPVRLGYAVAEVEPFLTTTLPLDREAHATRLNLALVAALTGRAPDALPGRPPTRFPLSHDEHEAAARWLAARGLGDGETLVAVHPGAGAAVKLWTGQAWGAVADALAADGARILLTGSPAEAALTADVAAHTRAAVIDAAGATDLPLLAALLARCALALGPDAGALHLATAVGAPTVRLYGPIDPRQFGPWGDPTLHRVILADPPLTCQFCERLDYAEDELPLHPCVRWITTAQVLKAARDVMAQAMSP